MIRARPTARWAGAWLPALVLVGCGGASERAEGGGGLLLVDATAASGLAEFRQRNGDPDKAFIIDSIGGALALLDGDGDGDLDLFLANGIPPPGSEEDVRDAYFENDGAGRFSDRSVEARLDRAGWTFGARAADYDGDGDTDLHLARHGANRLLRNDGHATFEDVTDAAGVGDERWSTGAAFVDHDRDGDLDLYVVNYLEFDRDWIEANRTRQSWRGVSVYYGPLGLPASGDRFWRNAGDGTFADATVAVGVAGPEHYGFQVVVLDADADGWVDLYVANDSRSNLLWRNTGEGTFEDVALRAGVALSRDGLAQAGMGIAVGDANGDLRPDLFVTNFSEDYHVLYRNDGRGLFTDVTSRVGLVEPTYPVLGWGCHFADLDLDGLADLFVANGHVYPQVDAFDLGTRYAQPNQLFRGTASGRFEHLASFDADPAAHRVSRGSAIGDLDHDGDLDLVVANLDAAPTLLVNESGRAGAWVQVALEGTVGPRDPIGAAVVVAAGGREWLGLYGTASGFLSTSSPRLHFGLGRVERIERLEVRWPSGTTEEHADLPVERLLRIEEGSAEVRVEELGGR
jgi:hypothetical protein